MTMKNKYLHPSSHIPPIPRGRLITAIIVGVIFALSFYFFLYICKEAIRIIFFMTDDNDVLVLSDMAVGVSNLILAYIASILGQSLCITYCLERALYPGGKHSLLIKTVINDQRSMNSYFLSWFSRLSIVFAMITGVAMGGGIYFLQEYIEYTWVFILIILVLFLHTWVNLRKLFNEKSLKWMFASAIIISLFSVILSGINIIDYQNINRIILSKNIPHSYRVKLPEAKYLIKNSSFGRRRATIWMVEGKNALPGSEPVVLVSHSNIHERHKYEKIPVDSLEKIFSQWDEGLCEEDMYGACVLYIHRDIQMKHINNLKKKLARIKANFVEYAAMPVQRQYDERYYNYLVFPLYIPNYFIDDEALNEVYTEIESMDTVFNITTTHRGHILIDSAYISHNNFTDFMYKNISAHPDYCVKYLIKSESRYADYIFINNSIMDAVMRLRNEYSIQVYREEYEYLEYEEQREVRQLFPYRILEIPE